MTDVNGQDRSTRREALRTLGRWCGLSALAGLSAWLLRRSVREGRIGSQGDEICGRCGAFLRCRLPRADAARRKGAGLAGPVRGTVPGRKGAVEPLCRQGREAARAGEGRPA